MEKHQRKFHDTASKDMELIMLHSARVFHHAVCLVPRVRFPLNPQWNATLTALL